MTWVFNSPIGRLRISQMRNGQFGLFYKEELCSVANDPETLANNVYVQSSDCYEWDSFNDKQDTCPSSLSEWEPETSRQF